jgi:predicted regulator of Ras-like GTPase activity (Roadblock/LC7/MglB family)
VFSDLLKKIVERVDGAEAAVILGLDGIIIERAGADGPVELDLIGAEYSSLLRNSLRTSSDTGLGSLHELLVVTEQATLIMKVLTPDYCILITLHPQANVGRARFELRKAQLLLAHEFAV